MKILIVDDEQMIRLLAEKILTRAGFEIVLTESGKEGVESLRADPTGIDLAIVDFSMEGMSGEDTIRALREIKPTLPAILSSGSAIIAEDLAEDIRPNTSYLQKPYRANDLTDRIAEVNKAVQATTQ